MKSQENVFWKTIDIFNKAKILPHILIIGSWAEYVYETSCYVGSGFKSNLKTMDIDFLIKNLRLPKNKIDLKSILEDEGYLISTSRTGITKFFKDGVIEIEFLAKEMGKGQIEPYMFEPLNIKVEGLRNMSILSDNAVVINLKNYDLSVPKPQAYIFHKLIINEKRGRKREKDIRSVKNLLNTIHKFDSEIEELLTIYNNLTKKEKQKVDKVCEDYFIDLFHST